MDQVAIFQSIYSEEVYNFTPPVVVVIGEPWRQLAENQKNLLSNILVAVRQSLDSVKVLHQPNFDLSQWSVKPSRIIAFLEPPKGLSLYEVIQTGATAILFSDPLVHLISDEADKRKLWEALKTLFQS